MAKHGKREAIMEAAERLCTSRRVHEITLDDIVHDAHVGKGTVYVYFKDKDDLFFQVAMSGFDEMCEMVRRRVAVDAPFREQLLQACDAVSAFFARRRQLFRMIQSEEARMPWRHGEPRRQWLGKRRELVAAMAGVIRRGQQAGVIGDEMDAETLASLLLGLLRTRGRELHETRTQPDLDALVDFFLNGARARSQTPEVMQSTRPKERV